METKLARLRNMMTHVVNYFAIKQNQPSESLKAAHEYHLNKEYERVIEIMPEFREILDQISDDEMDFVGNVKRIIDENRIPDMSGLSAEEKDQICKDFGINVSFAALSLFLALGIENYFEQMIINDHDKQEYILLFKKINKENPFTDKLPIDIDRVLTEAERTGWVIKKGSWHKDGYVPLSTSEIYKYIKIQMYNGIIK